MKRWVRFIGAALAIAALYFFARRVAQSGIELPADSAWGVLWHLMYLAVAYGTGVALLASLWSLIFAGSVQGTKRRGLTSAYLISQFWKYLPGNVVHFIGRHALSRSSGVSHSALFGGALMEAALLMFGATALAGAIAWRTEQLPWWAPGVASASAILLATGTYVLPRLTKRPSEVPAPRLKTLLVLWSGYVVFFAITGVIFWQCLRVFDADVAALHAIFSATAAWVAGYVVPGAPAGAGVRELALTQVLSEQAYATRIAGAVIAFRVVTMAGDFLAFLVGVALRSEALRAWSIAKHEQQDQ